MTTLSQIYYWVCW